MNRSETQIDTYLQKIMLFGNEINSLLQKARDEKCDVSKEVKRKYLYRLEVLDNFRNFVNSEIGKNLFSEQKEYYDKVLRDIVDIDSMNVGLLKSAAQEAKVALGKINSSKRVMLYSKGAGHEC
jgi:hypothetical protein